MSFFDSVEHIDFDDNHQPTGAWQNWSQNQQSFPSCVFQPVSTSELAAELQSSATEKPSQQQSNLPKYRAIGSGHSFSPLAKTQDTLVSLNKMTGLMGHDPAKNTVRVMAGTPLHQLSPLLDDIDQGMLNMGDINHQSIAGAVATGTHGTGAELPCISGLVKSLTLITPAGRVLECSAEHNKALYDAARVNLGCLGFVTEVELQNGPAYSLKESIEVLPLEEVLNNLDQLKDAHRHVEFFAFAYSDQVILKTLNPTKEEAYAPKAGMISDDALLKFFCETTKRFPKLTPFIHQQIARFIKPSTRVDVSHKIFATPRTVRFNEMEYQVPAEDGPACLRKVFAHIREHEIPAFFPIEYRYVAGDTIWLSPFYRRDSASISIHQYYKQDYVELFQALEPIFDQFQGRPHWGKIHTKTHQELKSLYSRWDQWQEIRKALDPHNQLMTPAMNGLLGEEE